ncbi:MAG: cobalamin-dependent protein [Candidatus Aminicenantes bacterium]|nr:MAG: cobalamin-dependent protein [Candidatus Aminicenantes bacterium]
MKVLLVTPPRNPEGFDSNSVFLMEPLALEYIGAGIKDHHDVRFVDLKADQEPELKEVLESYQPDVIGCGAFTADMNGAKQVCAEAKKLMPGILTVVGGQHATVMPRDFFQDSIDVVVVGEGVYPFKKICERHEKQKSFEDIENIYYRKNGTNREMVFTGKTEHPPLDTLPWPDRSLSAHLQDEYKLYLAIDKPLSYASLRASMGCPYNCKFCSVSSMLNRKVYRHSVERVIRELEALDAPGVFWVDDEFLIQPDKSMELAKAIEKAGIKKYHFVSNRSDTVINNPKVVEAWAKIGLKFIAIGMESYRDEELKALNKQTTVSMNEEAIRICHDNGIRVRGIFIVQQDYDKEDFRKLAEYTRGVGVDYSSFAVLTPLPGTELYEEKKSELIIHNYNLYDMFHTVLPAKLPLKRFYKEFTNLIKGGMSLKQKLKMVRKIPPKDRKKIITKSGKMYRRIKKYYRDYDKSMW